MRIIGPKKDMYQIEWQRPDMMMLRSVQVQRDSKVIEMLDSSSNFLGCFQEESYFPN